MLSTWRPILILIGMLAVPSLLPLRAQQGEVAYYYADEEADAAESDPYLASFQQPRIQNPPTGVLPESRGRSASSQGRSISSYARLARAPNMFGDSIAFGGQLLLITRDKGAVVTDLPLGGGRMFKISENNKPIPMDRVYFNYNGYVNALTYTSAPLGPPVTQTLNLNQYTFGFEKTFLDGFWSLDVRMPVTDGFQASSPSSAIDSGRIGNMAMFLKHMFYQDDSLAMAAGLGFGLPTGSNLDMFVNSSRLTVQNDAVHLLPYFGFFALLNENWFLQGFTDIDFATTGNDAVLDGTRLGRINEQNLAHVDLSLGRWLYRNPDAKYGQGLAGIFELHYTTTIQDADTFAFASSVRGGTIFGTFANPNNRIDVLNLTSGLHWQLTQLSNFRVGCVVPLRNDPNRQFDAEIQASFNRYF